MKSLLSFILSVSLVTQSYAASVVISGNINARSSMDFRSRNNIEAVIPAGSEGTVLERRKLPSGNYAIKMKITKLGNRSCKNLAVGDSVWVYYHKDEDRRVVELYDGNKKAKPETAKSAVAKQTFRIRNYVAPKTVPSPESCVTSSATDLKTTGALKNQISALNDLATKNIREVDVGVEEIASFMRTWRENRVAEDLEKEINRTYKDPDTRKAKLAEALQRVLPKERAKIYENDQKIAKNVKKYCAQYEVPIPVALAVMGQESQYKSKATSHAGAKGLMQLMPATARDLAGVKSGRHVDRYDIETSCKLGIKHLGDLLKDYDNDLRKVLIAYNAGPGKVNSSRLAGETKKYIQVVPEFVDEYEGMIAQTGLVLNSNTDNNE